MDGSVFWVLVGPVLETCLLALLAWRRAYREFPLFFCFFVFSIAAAVLRSVVQKHYDFETYVTVFWTTAFLYDILNLIVLYEVFRRVFQEFYRYISWFGLLFPAAVTVALLFAILFHIAFPPAHEPSRTTLLFSLEIAVDLIELALFSVFFLLVKFFSLPWRSHAFGIVLGFALLSIGSWGALWLRLVPGPRYEGIFRYIPAVAYIGTLVLWIVVFCRPEPKQESALTIKPEELLQEVKEYAKMLKALRRR